jgi:hypothetical protein
MVLIAVSSRIHHMIHMLRSFSVCLLICTGLLSVSTVLVAQEDAGLLCVAPFPKPICKGDVCLSGAQGFSCASGDVSLKVDSRKPVPWPKEQSMSLTGLAIDTPHRVAILCDSKPIQSFKLHFSDFKSNKACLSVNELYGWVQLWELDKHAPWCKCKQ